MAEYATLFRPTRSSFRPSRLAWAADDLAALRYLGTIGVNSNSWACLAASARSPRRRASRTDSSIPTSSGERYGDQASRGLGLRFPPDIPLDKYLELAKD